MNFPTMKSLDKRESKKALNYQGFFFCCLTIEGESVIMSERCYAAILRGSE